MKILKQIRLQIHRTVLLIFSLLITSLIISCGEDNEVAESFSAAVSVDPLSESVSEDAGSITIDFTLSRENTSGELVTIPLSVRGNATPGMDFESIDSNLRISAGSSSGELTIIIIDDQTEESDERIIIEIDTDLLPENLTVSGGNSVTITISDNDGQIADCPNDNSIDQDNHQCDETPHVSNMYSETINGNTRTITTNGIPTHDFRNQIPNIVSQLSSETQVYTITIDPEIAGQTTSITRNGNPDWKFGVALNGVPIDPAPAQPFIFENPNTGEFNFDWVFEPNWNMDAVGLDCAIAHVQPTGIYHYHGNMAIYADQLFNGIGTGNSVPAAPVQIGWAADGFPILYKYGPDANGDISELQSSYRIKSGNRPGDGISEPCGEYNGKYTNDFEFLSGMGDLDECNGIARSVTLGNETFDYFYVITDDFPVISRCISGTPSGSFKLGG